MKQYEETIYEIITKEYGFTTRLKGSFYLKEAVILVLENPKIPTMQIYQILGTRYHIRSSSLECSIRTVVSLAYDEDKINAMFPFSAGKPTNSEVIWTIAEYVKSKNLITLA